MTSVYDQQQEHMYPGSPSLEVDVDWRAANSNDSVCDSGLIKKND